MRSSDCSADVCSSDLQVVGAALGEAPLVGTADRRAGGRDDDGFGHLGPSWMRFGRWTGPGLQPQHALTSRTPRDLWAHRHGMRALAPTDLGVLTGQGRGLALDWESVG